VVVVAASVAAVVAAELAVAFGSVDAVASGDAVADSVVVVDVVVVVEVVLASSVCFAQPVSVKHEKTNAAPSARAKRDIYFLSFSVIEMVVTP
jgi:hypothetical protein